nr:hypothetical protein Iba_chr12aCG1970 [Ipomoea batatas]
MYVADNEMELRFWHSFLLPGSRCTLPRMNRC